MCIIAGLVLAVESCNFPAVPVMLHMPCVRVSTVLPTVTLNKSTAAIVTLSGVNRNVVLLP